MNNFNFEAMMEHGFLIIPKALLQQQIEDPNIEAGEIEALLKILMKVNYSDTLYSDRQHKDYLCKRGESMFSYRDWSRIFRWSVGKTFRFIHALAILGIIEIVPHPNNSSLHIRVVEYDKWVGAPDSGKQKKKAVNEKFRLFWNEFHSITQLPKENIAKAQREWKKLSDMNKLVGSLKDSMDSTNGEMENIFSLLENISAEAMHFDSIILNNENNIRSIDEKASVTNSIAQKLNTLTRSNAQTAAQINDVVEKFN